MPKYLQNAGIIADIFPNNTSSHFQHIKSKELFVVAGKVFNAICLLCLLLNFSCKPKTPTDDTTPSTDVIAPDRFGFTTTKDIQINIQFLAGDDKPIPKVPVEFYSSDNGQKDQSYLKQLTDASGYIKATITIPSYVDTLIVSFLYTGVLQNAKAYISGGQITGVIGGSKGFSGNIAANETKDVDENDDPSQPTSATYTYMGDYDASTGKPAYLTQPGDVISSSLLSYVNASLPEGVRVTDLHPAYLSSTSSTTLNVQKQSDVWITFVSEDAGFTNALGYYTYSTSNPPKSISDIKKVTYILPNASFYGAGGALISGNKVKLGNFASGTSIGFVLFQNGWNGSKVDPESQKWYSDDAINNETLASDKRHSVLLYDSVNKIFLVGFEDLRRENKNSDDDFNDLVFYATTSVNDAVSPITVNPAASPKDADGDGILDNFDQFPTDPTKAFIQYFPSQSGWGTLAFEDQWPKVGDYDLNDLVVGYRYTLINNASNQTVEMTGSYMIRAVGATFNNGLGIEMPFTPDKLSSVTGQRVSGSYVILNSVGYEDGQTNAVIIPFDKTTSVIKSGYINTKPDTYFTASDTVNVRMVFKAPIATSSLGAPPFNPFLMINQKRGYEVHLPNNKPTDKADKSLLGTVSDNSDPSTGSYYISTQNWPFALSFYENFDYPLETAQINKAYLHFFDWTNSGGTKYLDWYKNTSSGYRDASYIYKGK